MDDVHFILRHAMTGAVFAIFVAVGFTLMLPDQALGWLKQLENFQGDWIAGGAAFALIAFPIIGITVQGAYFSFHTMISGTDWFEDPARKYVAQKIRLAIEECRGTEKSSDVSVNWSLLESAPDDAFFVWLYHHRATPHMIEWARRRRSYYYLGWNWVLAAAAGIFVGLLASTLPWPGRTWITALLGLGLLWAGGAIWAAERMRRDADTMEAIWAASQIDPEFRDCLTRSLPGRQVESLGRAR